MVFNSLTYLLLLSSVVFLFWNISYNKRFYLIFLSSLIFYGFWKIEFIPLLLFSTFLDWWISLRMVSKIGRERKYLLLTSLFANLGILFFFKYLIFFTDNTINLLNFFDVKLDPIAAKIILPLGISFYTFQTISYTVDVYRKVIKPEKNFIVYACYVTFFPQLIAGPILRAKEIISQFKKFNSFEWGYILKGLRRVLYGLFLKVVIADNIAPMVNGGFGLPVSELSAFDVWTLAFLFGFQIYFDFCGYSHIALGSAKMIGITFPENFNFPYLANSPKDFWRRWHISLSSWVRDYIYLPLLKAKLQNSSSGGLEKATLNKKDQKSLFITWGLMGFWHGANWTFLVWGLYHAIFIFIYRIIRPFTNGIHVRNKNILGWFFTLPIIMLSWIPFRADNLEISFNMWMKIIDPSKYSYLGLQENIYIITLIITLGILFTYFIKKLILINKLTNNLTIIIGDILFISFLFYFTFIFLRPINQFIYFQF